MKDLKLEINVGDKVILGKEYCKRNDIAYTGKELEFVDGVFDNDNGLYCYETSAPSLPNELVYRETDWNYCYGELESIYYLFGNKLENIMDCKIIKQKDKKYGVSIGFFGTIYAGRLNKAKTEFLDKNDVTLEVFMAVKQLIEYNDKDNKTTEVCDNDYRYIFEIKKVARKQDTNNKEKQKIKGDKK